MLQSATSSEFDTFPSTSEDHYRSLQSSVAVEVEDIAGQTFVGIEADLRLADGQSIAGFYVAASGYLKDANLLTEIESCRGDLEAFKTSVDKWYDDAYTALLDAERDIANANRQMATVA